MKEASENKVYLFPFLYAIYRDFIPFMKLVAKMTSSVIRKNALSRELVDIFDAFFAFIRAFHLQNKNSVFSACLVPFK